MAQLLLDNGIAVVSFQRLEYEPVSGDPISDVDVETDRAIIEVTTGKKRKIEQIDILRSDTHLNPSGKLVILFAPSYKKFVLANVLAAGYRVARSDQELLNIIRSLP